MTADITHINELARIMEKKDTTEAFSALKELEQISDETGLVYPYIMKFLMMVTDERYVIRVRGFRLFCKQARWDTGNIIDNNIDIVLGILSDEKPTAVRQALSALIDVVKYKPTLREKIYKTVLKIDFQKYKDTMRGLIEKDVKYLCTQMDIIK